MKENNDKNQYASCLLKVPIFSHLDESEQEEIVDLIRVKKVKKVHTTLYRTWFYYNRRRTRGNTK